MKFNLEWLPRKCAYCDGPIVCLVTKRKGFKITSIYVCELCANEIWAEETNRRLPQ